jgi:membrane-bound serine protease (ClpP class)
MLIMTTYVLAALLGIGFVAIFIELFVPAAGLIGAAGVITMIVSTVLAYVHHGKATGTVFLACLLLGTPAVLWVGLKAFPRTFVGKRLILKKTFGAEEGYTSYSGEKYKGLAGREGVAVTTLRPSGMARIEGVKYSVVTGGELIEKNQPVRVVKVEGSRIVVKKLSKI